VCVRDWGGGWRSNYARVRDAQAMLKMEECVTGMGQRSNDVVATDAQAMLEGRILE